MDTRTFPSSLVSAVIEAAVSKGIDRHLILERLALPPEILEADKGRVDAKTLHRIIMFIALELNDECLGFAPESIKPGNLIMMTYACLTASKLSTALRRMCRYYELTTNNFTTTLETNGDFSYVTVDPGKDLLDSRNYFVPSLLGITLRWMTWLVNEKVKLDHAALTSPRPAISADLNFLFSCPIRFDQDRNYICFASAYLDKPLAQNEQTLKDFFAHGAVGLLANPKEDDTLRHKIQLIIRDKVNEEFPELDDVANQLNMTSATLRRHLKHEGCSYQQIKDDIRRDIAIYLLSRGTLAIERIAEEVGFSEPTSFFRAFKRWTGVTPRSYLKAPTNERS